MAKLTSKARKRIPSSEFGIPSERAFPVEDKPHARAAKSRASQAEHAGRISKSTEEKIDRKADKKLHVTKKRAANNRPMHRY